jgi:hypothetical protein
VFVVVGGGARGVGSVVARRAVRSQFFFFFAAVQGRIGHVW